MLRHFDFIAAQPKYLSTSLTSSETVFMLPDSERVPDPLIPAFLLPPSGLVPVLFLSTKPPAELVTSQEVMVSWNLENFFDKNRENQVLASHGAEETDCY